MATTSSGATSRASRVAAILAIAAVVVGVVAVALLRRPEPTGPPADGVPPIDGRPRPPADPRASVDVSLITVMYGVKTERPGTDRAKEAAYQIASIALARLGQGERFERVLEEVTDDRNEVGKPFNDGSYTFARTTPAAAAVKRLAFSTPVGLVHREPIDTGVAFVILRRDR